MRKLRTWIHAAILIVVAFSLRRWGLDSEPAGFEEVTALHLGQAGIGAYIHAPNPDLCPPVYYALMALLRALGTQLWGARFFSVLVGTATPVLLYVLLRRSLGGVAAGLAALVLAVSPPHVFFSQEAQPAALFMLAAVAAFWLLLRTADTLHLTDWIAFDAAAVVLLHLHHNAVFLILAFLLIHLGRVFLFRPPDEQRRPRRRRLVGLVLYNYLVIFAVSLPWLVVMFPVQSPWLVEQPSGHELLRVPARYLWFGVMDDPAAALRWIVLVIAVLLIPPVIRTAQKGGLPQAAVAAVLVLTLLLGYAQSHLGGQVRFDPQRDVVLVLPFFALLLGVLLARCNFFVRIGLLAAVLSVLGVALVQQVRVRDKHPWDTLAAEVDRRARPEDLIVFWPDFTREVGRYYFGNAHQLVPASELFEKWADSPAGRDVYFVLTQYPMKDLHAYTFLGALRHYSKAEVLWGQRMNQVVRCRNLEMDKLNLWFSEPKSLNLIDAPTTATQFIFYPSDPVVFKNDKFHWREPDLIYDYADGRRAIWTAQENVELRLPVTLAPGSYVLKVHCSPDHYQAAKGRMLDRAVDVVIGVAEERRRARIEGETTLSRPFSTETEMRSLTVHIEAGPLAEIRRPEKVLLGLKIYSISVEQVDDPGAL